MTHGEAQAGHGARDSKQLIIQLSMQNTILGEWHGCHSKNLFRKKLDARRILGIQSKAKEMYF